MKYLMLVCVDGSVDLGREDDPTESGGADTAEPWVAEAGPRRLTGDRLRPPAEATTVRIRDGRVLVSDGPYAEAKEQIAGFDVLECADLDEAVALAAKHPVAAHGVLELRAFWSG